MKHDYRYYRFTKKEAVRYLAEALFLCAGINYLCYRSWWAFIPMLPVPWLYLKIKRKKRLEQKKKQLNYAFKDAVNSLSVALKAGYSMENAISECIRDLKNIYPEDAPIVEEFCYIRSQLKSASRWRDCCGIWANEARWKIFKASPASTALPNAAEET